jgi:tRNA(Arg) A34 adenosine deaminase TadA
MIPAVIYRSMHQRALKISPVRRQRIVSYITTKDGLLVAEGWCQLKTHPLQKEFGGDKKIYLHAEIDAIAQARRFSGEDDLSGYIMYVLRLKNNEEIGDAKPCQVCRGAIIRFGISQVEWTLGSSSQSPRGVPKVRNSALVDGASL